MQPNLRALERYDDVSRRVKESSDAYEQAKNAAQQANAHFAQLRQQRKVHMHTEKERGEDTEKEKRRCLIDPTPLPRLCLTAPSACLCVSVACNRSASWSASPRCLRP